MGGVWEGLGRLLGALGRSLAVLLGVQKLTSLKHRSKIGSKRASAWIVGRFWEGFERISGGFGGVWGKIFFPFGDGFGKVWPPKALSAGPHS